MYVPTFPLSRIISLQRAEDNACANNGRLLDPSHNNARGKREIRFPVLSIQSWFLWLHRIECGQFKENGLATVGITWNFTDLKGNFSIQPFKVTKLGLSTHPFTKDPISCRRNQRFSTWSIFIDRKWEARRRVINLTEKTYDNIIHQAVLLCIPYRHYGHQR